MKVFANSIQVHYQEAGNGPPLILIHALGVNLSMWDAQVPPFSHDYRVLAYDVRGQGQTEAPLGPYSLSLFTEDLRALMDSLEVDSAFLLGLSMGGMIAQQMAITYPHRARGLILADTRSAVSEESRLASLERAGAAEEQGMEPLIEPTIQRWFVGETIERRPSLVEHFRRMLRRNDPVAYASCARAIADLDLTAQLHRISSPTLVIVGEQDLSTPVADARAIHESIQGSELLIIPNARHMSAVERPELFNKAVLEFLSKRT